MNHSFAAQARAGDLSTRGGEYATARTLLGKTKIDYAARTFAARLAVASARRRRLLRRRDARTLLFADVLCRKDGDLLTVRRLTGSAFDDFSRRRRRAPETPGGDDDEDRERRRAKSPAGDGALRVLPGAAAGDGAAVVGAAALEDSSDSDEFESSDDDDLAPSSGSSESEESDREDAYPGVAGGPGGVRLARGGGALVAVAELRSEVVAYGLGLPAAGSPEERAFWDACRAVTEKARRKAEARKAEDELRTLALDRRSLRRYGAYYARRPLAAWNSRIALLLRRDGAPDGDLRVPWRDVLAAAARDGNPVVEPRGGDPHRDAWVVPLVTRADRGGASHCLVAVHCRAAGSDGNGRALGARLDVLAPRRGPPLSRADGATIRAFARDVHAALLLRVAAVCRDPRGARSRRAFRDDDGDDAGREPSAHSLPQLLSVFSHSPPQQDKPRPRHARKNSRGSNVESQQDKPRGRGGRNRLGGRKHSSRQRGRDSSPPADGGGGGGCVLS